MRIDDTGALVLSRRNLLALLHKLDMPDSARTISKSMDGVILTVGGVHVKAEDDDEHYRQTEFPTPGRMHPDTEAFIHDQSRSHEQ